MVMAPYKSAKKQAELSKKVNKGYGNSGMKVGVDLKAVNISKTLEEVEFESEKLKAMFTSLGFDRRAHFDANPNDIPFDDGNNDYEDDIFPMASAPPPGQEGTMHSNEGNNMFDEVVNRLLTHSNR
ncbi:hypothetical protein V5O48_019174, partial [Marasmius crinis-equi]